MKKNPAHTCSISSLPDGRWDVGCSCGWLPETGTKNITTLVRAWRDHIGRPVHLHPGGCGLAARGLAPNHEVRPDMAGFVTTDVKQVTCKRCRTVLASRA